MPDNVTEGDEESAAQAAVAVARRAEQMRVEMFNANVVRLASMIDALAVTRHVRVVVQCAQDVPDGRKTASHMATLSRVPCVGESLLLESRCGVNDHYEVVGPVMHYEAGTIIAGVEVAASIPVLPEAR